MNRKNCTAYFARIAILATVLAPMALAGCDSTKHEDQNPAQASMAQAAAQPPKPDCDMPDTNCQNQNY